MAVTLVTDWTGGAAGATVTTATEPTFTAANGSTRIYGPAIGGFTGASLEVSGSGDMALSLGGRSHARVGYALSRVSGTQSATCYVADFRGGGTLRGNIVLHNTTNPGRLSCRVNTTIGGTSTRTLTAGEVWWVEVEYQSGVGYSFHIWYDLPATGAPDDTFFISSAATADTFRLGNSGGTTGLTLRFGPAWISDGEQIAPAAPAAGSVEWALNGYATDTTFAVNVKATGETTAGIEYDTAGTFTAPTYVAASSKGDGYWQATATGLPSKVRHYWRAVVDSVPSAVTGSLTTLPPAGVEAHTFAWGSCWWDTAPADVFTNIVARDPAFVTLLGDYGYTYITGGPNGNASPTDVATVRANRLPSLTAAGSRTLTASRPVHYVYSDCDGAGANSDGTTGGHATGAVQQAYRQQHAHPTLPLSNCGARSWVVGRVRYILTDETATATARRVDSGDPLDWQNATKRKMDAAQTAWFLGELDAAMSAGQAVVWFGDGPWIEPGGSSPGASNTYQSWAWYHAQRVTLGAEIAARRANGLGIVRLHGDTHTLFVDDGSNNPWGGFPTASAAPFNETAQSFGVATSGPKWPTTTTNSSRQYAVGSVADDGDTLTLTIRGYSSTTGAPTEVERYSQTFTLLEEHTATGGSTTSVGVTAAGAGRKRSTGGSVAAVSTAVDGAGRKSTRAASTAAVTAAVVGAGKKTRAGASTVAVTATATGAGYRRHIGTSATTADVIASGAGFKVARGGSVAAVTLAAVGAGVRVQSGQGGSSTSTTVTALGAGIAARRGGAVAGVTTATVGDGRRVEAGQGGSTIDVTIGATGAGRPVRRGDAVALVGVVAVGAGVRVQSGQGGSTVAVSAVGAGRNPGDWRDITVTLGPPVPSRFTVAHPARRTFAIGTPRRTT